MAELLNLTQPSQLQLEELQNLQNGSFSVGPLLIEWDFNPAVPQLVVTFYLSIFGRKIKIGGITINPQHPTATFGGTFLGVTIKATFTFDFNTKNLTYDITVGPIHKSGSIHL